MTYRPRRRLEPDSARARYALDSFPNSDRLTNLQVRGRSHIQPLFKATLLTRIAESQSFIDRAARLSQRLIGSHTGFDIRPSADEAANATYALIE